ncbi:MAG: pyruvate kinase, partial [Gammaproteobacteria bacterium]|nr:pyruvate kinase [Gammaproteobacteria bacterium]
NVIRLNMSHGDEKTHRLYVERVRRVSKRLGKHTAIIMDLCGPKMRVGKFTNGYIELIQGQNITITSRKASGDENLIHSQYKGLYKDVKKGNRIFLDDGRLEFTVTSIVGKDVRCKVVQAGI